MKKRLLQTAIATLILAFTAVINNVHAQQSNSITEVQLTKNSFDQLRKIVSDNFDFTQPGLPEGNVSSSVKFEVDSEGKISNVVAKSSNAAVKTELQKTFESVLYRFRPVAKNKDVYVMPVNLVIASR